LVASFVVGVLTLLFLTMVLPGTTMRYEVDYATFLVLPGLVGWFVLTSGRRRRVVAILGASVILYGCVVGAAISFTGYYDGLRTTHPSTYWALDRLTSPLPTALTMILGHPVIARAFPAGQTTPGNTGTYGIGTGAFGLTTARIELDIISPRSGHWALAPTFSRGPGAGHRRVSIAVRLDNGVAYSVRVGSRPTAVPLKLHRGLNRVELGATTSGSPLGSAAVLVSVKGLRLSAT
jgi:hypothetical protein